MNEFQFIQQMEYILGKAVWPGVGGEIVFGGVVIAVRQPKDITERFGLPIAIMAPASGISDPLKDEDEGLFRQGLSLRLLSYNAHDAETRAGIIGGNRKDNLSSDGRGILEIQERIFAEMKRMGDTLGIRILSRLRTSADVGDDEDVSETITRDYLFEAFLGDERFYHAPTRLIAVSPGAGEVDLAWKESPDRFDFVNFRVVRKVGAVAPTGPTDGTTVVNTTVGDLTDITFSDTGLAADTYSYAVFTAYDEDSDTPANQDTFSAGDTFEGVVVA